MDARAGAVSVPLQAGSGTPEILMPSHASGSGHYLINTMSPACRGVWWARDADAARPRRARGTPVLHGYGTRDSPPADVSLGLTHPLSCLHRYLSDPGNWSRRRIPGACRRPVCYGGIIGHGPAGNSGVRRVGWRQVAVAWPPRGASRLGCRMEATPPSPLSPPAVSVAYVTADDRRCGYRSADLSEV